ncbi:MAG: bifunctional 2-polyprenyl-6-hydroxyphenol methylase/3-demethylubiquinol 3-O-methyltransferase UbiG [Pseudomonadota bacterium]
MSASAPAPAAPSIDPNEVAKFSAMAAEWWDPFGKFKPLHKFNPTRLGFIRDQACLHFERDRQARRPLDGLSLLDIGCGGGLVCEPMRRLGAQVTGLDASEKNVAIAATHAGEQKLDIDYRAGSAEDLAAAGEGPFDIVLNLEVVEHVADVEGFLATSARLTAPGGMMVVATINRTLKALALAKIGAEYILRWLPMGTHEFKKFVTPKEASAPLEAEGLSVHGPFGVSYNPLADVWSISRDSAVNYMLVAKRP